MRTYGRPVLQDGTRGPWQLVQTDANGNDDFVWITTLAQVLLLNLGESPFYANYGIPARQSVITQVFPDFYVSYTQQRFAQYFASLIIAKVPDPTPTYTLNIVTNSGVRLTPSIPVPQ